MIKRRLFPVTVEGAAAGTPVEHDGREVSEIRSGLGDRALAMLQVDAAEGPLTADGTMLHAERPAWMRIDAKPCFRFGLQLANPESRSPEN